MPKSDVDIKAVEDDRSGEEVDQLDTSDDVMQRESQVTDITPDETRPLFDNSRPSSLEVQK